jgi:hypothetical protein
MILLYGEMKMGTPPASVSDDSTLQNYPVIVDAAHNLVIFLGAFIASQGFIGGLFNDQIAGILMSALGMGLSAIHVRKTSIFGVILNALSKK